MLIVALPAWSQDAGRVLMHRFGTAQGLPNEQSRRVVEMPDGRMLVEVEGMFALFDGERFQPLEYNRQETVPLESFLNTDHWLTTEGLLWVKDAQSNGCGANCSSRRNSPS